MFFRISYLILVFTILVIPVLTAPSAPAMAEKRVALVIGNSQYQHTTKLANPANDARAMAASLKRLNFEVVEAFDTDIDGLAASLDQFSRKLQGADVGLFYYAGHGLSFGGKNYVVPVDARLESQFRLRRETVPIDEILEEMAAAARINLLFLDACRNNPLADGLKRSIRTASRATSISRGLSLMQPRGEESLIVFATGPGEVAEDGRGNHSPFTKALLNHIERSGIDIEVMLKAVQRDVKRETGNTQRPERWSKLESIFEFKPGLKENVRLRDLPRGGSENIDRREEQIYWESVKDLGDGDLIRSYLSRYPDGKFVGIARVLLRNTERPSTDARTKPSFDCNQHKGELEQAICGSPRLSRLDHRMAAMYFRAKGLLRKKDADQLLHEQRTWISKRNNCRTNAACLDRIYQDRLTRLKEWGG